APPDLEDVAEARGGEESRPRPLLLEEGVDADGRPVDDQPAVRQAQAGLVDAPEHTVEQVARGAEGLGGGDRAGGLVQGHQVRERAPDAAAEGVGHRDARCTREYGGAEEEVATSGPPATVGDRAMIGRWPWTPGSGASCTASRTSTSWRSPTPGSGRSA